jgi:hypothetical protein
LENTEENCEMIWKIWKKSKLNSDKIWKIWRKSKLNSEKMERRMRRRVGRRWRRRGSLWV